MTDVGDPRIALCLSGGGFRAMVFHLGTLLRLNDAGLLPELDLVSSVSGGSITAAVLGSRWDALEFGHDGRATNLDDVVVSPVRQLASRTIHWLPIVVSTVSGPTAGRILAKRYGKALFGEATLPDLTRPPDGPRFVINATSFQTGGRWALTHDHISEYHVGTIRDSTMLLRDAVAASAAYPPILGPLVHELDPDAFVAGSGDGCQKPPYTSRAVMSDGGVYDNLGLQAAERYGTVLVSDGGARPHPVPRPKVTWLGQFGRARSVADFQVRALRKRHLIADFEAGRRHGTYFGIGTDIANYGLSDALPAPVDRTKQLAALPTRLGKLSSTTQEQLINWAYAVCDAALRSHTDLTDAGSTRFPFAAVGV